MSADICRPVTVTGDDGQPITVPVHGAEPMTDEARGYFEQIVQDAERWHAAQPGCPNHPPCEHAARFHRDGACPVRRPRPCGCGSA